MTDELQKIADWQLYKPRWGGELDLKNCAASVPDGGGSITFHQCQRKGIIEECGYKWCKIHSPSYMKKKREKQDQKYREEQIRQKRIYVKKSAYDNIAATAIDYFKQKSTHDDLEKAVMYYERLCDI